MRLAVYEPHVGEAEIANLASALSANELIRGRFADQFESKIASYVGTRFAVGTNSGTAAIHTALMLAGVERGDEVLINTMSFIAPANAIAYCGASPVFVDSSEDNWQMDATALEEFCERGCQFVEGRLVNRTTGRPVVAIVLVHFLGMAAEMVRISDVAKRFNLILIEDAAQALGTAYHGKKVGSFGKIGCFSFYGNKLITAGGGGMIVTDDEALARRARYLINQAKDDPVETIHNEIGYNYRMTNIHGAIGCAQFDRIDQHIAGKRRIAEAYRAGLTSQPGITMPAEPADQFWTYWLSSIRIDPVSFGMDARSLLRHLATRDIETIPLYQPLHQSKAHPGCSFAGAGTAVALHKDVLTLPCSVGLTAEDIAFVIAEVVAAGQTARAEAQQA